MTWPNGTNVTQATDPNSFSILDDPGHVNPPAIFEPDPSYTQGIQQLWVAASGKSLWGGAIVWLSLDGLTYHPIGDIENPARQGLLSATLPSHGDPDTSNLLSVDLAHSFGTLDLDATHDDADFGRTLCWVTAQFLTDAPCDGELISYGHAVAGALPNAYRLSYLRRGAVASTISTHPTGSLFTRIDTVASVGGRSLSLLRFNLPVDYVGVTLFIKFQSFNRFGQSLEGLDNVVPYTYTPCGAGIPTVPMGLGCSGLMNAILLTWVPNPPREAVTSYEIYRASGHGAAFAAATLVATTTSTIWADPGLDPLSEWTYFVEACNAIACSPPTMGCDATVGDDDDTCDMQDIYSGTSV